MNQGFEIKEKTLALSQALLDNHPKIPILLREIHTYLRSDPEVVTLMTEEDIAILIKGLIRQTGVEIANGGAKGAGKKAASKLTVDDI